MAILITGGAGYIGSHMVKYLQDKIEEVIVVDNLQSGHRESIEVAHFYNIDLRDREQLKKVFGAHYIEAVIHLAASALVGESMAKPFEYYHNNVYGMLCLLEALQKNKVKKIVFSSTAAVYGEPKKVPIQEDAETNPTNIYGETKLVIEKMIQWFGQAWGMKYVALRYFNVAGAHESGLLGEDHHPETHLIPLILQVPLGKRERVILWGADYPTPDGTGVRDYIHVMDLAAAHYQALEYLRNGNDSDVFNLGNGKDYSVREVIETAEKVTGRVIPVEIKERRSGDPAVLIAATEKARSKLGWKPKFTSLPKIIADAWQWHRGNPDGFK